MKTYILSIIAACAAVGSLNATCLWSNIGYPIGKVGWTDGWKIGDSTLTRSIYFDTSVDGVALFFGHVGNYGSVSVAGVSMSFPRVGYPNVRYSREWWKDEGYRDGDGTWHSNWKRHELLGGSDGGTGLSYMVGRNASKMIGYAMNPFGSGKYQFSGGQGARWATDGVMMRRSGDLGRAPMSISVTGMLTGWLGMGYPYTATTNEVSLAPIAYWPKELFSELLLPEGRMSLTTSPGTGVGLVWDNGIISGFFNAEGEGKSKRK